MSDHSLSPPTVTDAEKPLHRQVAMAYRTAREAMRSHEDAIDAAEAVYFKAHPDGLTTLRVRSEEHRISGHSGGSLGSGMVFVPGGTFRMGG
jgi:hypothetical protein